MSYHPSKNAASSFTPPQVYHITTLPLAHEARTLLDRVVREFLPIIQRRQYNVTSISEMCCCGDGLDSIRGRRRKCRIMGKNIWGYNMTTTTQQQQQQQHGRRSSSHAIHLRLRHVSAHTTRLHLYEDVAGTLAHELAHCVHGPHNKAFYKLMDEIFDEHAQSMAAQLTMTDVGGSGSKNALSMPAFGGTGHVLGTRSSSTPTAVPLNPQQLAAARLQALGGTVLGGNNASIKRHTPQEAALAAALLRQTQQQVRLRGNRACQPCTIVIDDDDDENNDGDDQTQTNNTNNKARSRGDESDGKFSAKKEPEIIVLDEDDVDSDEKSGTENRNPQKVPALQSPKKRRKKDPPSSSSSSSSDTRKKPPPSSVIDLTEDDEQVASRATISIDDTKSNATGGPKALEWGCQTCTFWNQATDGSCAMCLNPR